MRTRILSTAHAVARRALLAPYVARTLAHATGVQAAIFMLHRFSDSERGIIGPHEPDVIGEGLALLRREGFEFVAIDELIRRLQGDGPPPVRSVAFTLDDGYVDQATVAAPLFAHYDCPVTTFLATDFLDGIRWMWWDRVEYVLHGSTQRTISTVCGNEPVTYRLDTPATRNAAQHDFIQRCKRISEQEKEAALALLAIRADVDVPAAAPTEYAAMTWDQARRCEASGMTFGAHTRSHPVLARTTDDQARAEIAGSWKRVREELRRPVDIFCYPNGGTGDYGAREISMLQAEGFSGALISQPAYPLFDASSPTDSTFRIPRFGYPAALSNVVRCAAGLGELPGDAAPA